MVKIIFVIFGLLISSASFADLSVMMKVYNNPNSAPKVTRCHGNITCNGFVALAKQWKDIPIKYRYHGFDIRQDAKMGDGYGLNKGFYLNNDKSINYSEVGNDFFYKNGGASKSDEAIFGRGLAVLLYIEDKNGWSKN